MAYKTLQQYIKHLPLQNLTIYVSTIPKGLPIVIDTGESCSITPKLQDFTTKPSTPVTKSIGWLTGTQTEVLGLGNANWDIEDVIGICCSLETAAYIVADASIYLFSAKIYIDEHY